ncbi:TRI39 ligase, partial [Atractosteus spatula]|nr:TRI39 ligase [Atractosteus spatula]
MALDQLKEGGLGDSPSVEEAVTPGQTSCPALRPRQGLLRPSCVSPSSGSLGRPLPAATVSTLLPFLLHSFCWERTWAQSQQCRPQSGKGRGWVEDLVRLGSTSLSLLRARDRQRSGRELLPSRRAAFTLCSMASALEDALVCAVCLDLFQEPVSLPCGHSFCQACIQRHWKSSGDHRCPQCRQPISDPLALRRNLSLAEVAEQLRARARASVPLCDACPATPARPPAALSCTLCLLALCEDHARRHLDNPAFRGHRLLPTTNPSQGSPQTRKAKPDQNRSPNQEALKATKEGILERQSGIERLDAATESLRASLAQERRECEQTLAQLAESLAQLSGQAAELFRRAEEESMSRSAEIRQHLERELSELRERESTWSQLALRESTGEEALEAQTPAAPLPSEPGQYDLTTLSFGDLRAALTALHRRLEEVCTQELQRAWRPGLDSVSKYATSIQLDPDTAHPCLIVSKDRRGVQACTRRQPLPQGPQRFNRVYFVLGCTAFSSGRHYWEVEVGSKKLWRVGLFRSSAPRNGVIPDEAFWLLEGDRGILSVKGKRDAPLLSTHVPRTVASIQLNPDTAHPCLIVSKDRRGVQACTRRQPLPQGPQRFNRVYFVLGCTAFSSGRHYWEVEVGSKKLWRVGLFRSSAPRNGVIPDEAFWLLEGDRGILSVKGKRDAPLLSTHVPRTVGLDSVSKYATSIQLNPDTAHPCLIVSKDRRGVQACTRRQPLPQGPQRFNRVYFVLGCTAFSSGRHYWEVEVGSKKLWRVGLFRSSAPRNGVIPDEAFWLLEGDRGILSVKGKRDAPLLSTHVPRTVGLDSVSKYATSIQLDPDTAHPCLIVSKDRRGVQACTRRQPLPQGPQRFNRVYFVLGCTAFSSGRHYWEVEVGSKKLWRVGLFRSSAPRNGVIPDEAFWLLEGDRGILSVKGKRDAPLLSTHVPRTVGVFLDWDGGILSFYDAEQGATPVCTLTDSFSEELYPVFSPGLKNDGQLLLC